MRVLVWPQLSMRSYETGKWHLEMDPNLNKCRAWAKHVDYDWWWLLPEPAQLSEESVKGTGRVNWATIPWAPNVQASRFNFPFSKMVDAIRYVNPDVMICEFPEHVKAIRMAQRFLTYNADFPVVSYVDYAPIFGYTHSDARVSTWERQVEGAIESSLLVFNTPGLREKWMDAAEMLYADGTMADAAIEMSSIWPGVYSPDEIDAENGIPRDDPPAVFYTSRLSDPAKNRHPEFFEALRRVHEMGIEFQTWIGDPNRAFTDEELMGMAPNVTKLRCSSREEYLQMMNRAAVVPCLWAQDMIYSIGYCDTLAAGAISIVAAEDESRVSGIRVPSEANADQLEDALSTALACWKMDTMRNSVQQSQRRWLMENRSVEENARKMVDDLECLVKA